MCVGYAQLEKSNQKQQNEAKKENKKTSNPVCLLFSMHKYHVWPKNKTKKQLYK